MLRTRSKCLAMGNRQSWTACIPAPRLGKAPFTEFTRDSLPAISEDELDAFFMAAFMAASQHMGLTAPNYAAIEIEARKGELAQGKELRGQHMLGVHRGTTSLITLQGHHGSSIVSLTSARSPWAQAFPLDSLGDYFNNPP